MESRPITTKKTDMVTLIQRFRLKLQILGAKIDQIVNDYYQIEPFVSTYQFQKIRNFRNVIASLIKEPHQQTIKENLANFLLIQHNSHCDERLLKLLNAAYAFMHDHFYSFPISKAVLDAFSEKDYLRVDELEITYPEYQLLNNLQKKDQDMKKMVDEFSVRSNEQVGNASQSPSLVELMSNFGIRSNSMNAVTNNNNSKQEEEPNDNRKNAVRHGLRTR